MMSVIQPGDSRFRARLSKCRPHAQRSEAASAEVRSESDAATKRSLQAPHRLAEDVNGSHLVSFPFAFTVSLVSGSGLIVAGIGVIATNPRLAGMGMLATLAGCLLYGWSLYDHEKIELQTHSSRRHQSHVFAGKRQKAVHHRDTEVQRTANGTAITSDDTKHTKRSS